MRRAVDKWLLDWKRAPGREVLLLRGARQVGKTYSVRRLGETFKHVIEVNLEQDRAVRSFFSGSLDPAPICEKLSGYYRTPIIPGETLVFFDEVQACPEAFSSLRFFHEKTPDLHVAAAGSLLEFVLGEIPSQGVGRIQSLFMYSMSFPEFLNALDEDSLLAMIAEANADAPLDDAFHDRLVNYARTFQLIGGMPKVVNSYIEKHDLNECMGLLDDLLVTLRDDFAKYKRRAPVARLAEVYDAVFFQAGKKFVYSRIDSSSSLPPLKTALNMLVKAGLAIKVHHSSARGRPLAAGASPGKFKVLPSDTGLYQRAMGLDISKMLVEDVADLVNKGSLAEIFVGLELIRAASPRIQARLHYWHREARGSQAEVDYVIEAGPEILPVEVKAGSSGRMRSMHRFMSDRNLQRGIRTSLENFSKYGGIETVPLYAIWCVA